MMHARVGLLLCRPVYQRAIFEVPSFTNSKDMIGAKFKKKRITWQWPRPLGQCVTPRLALDIFYLHAKFGDSSRSRDRPMIAGVKIENGSFDLTTPLLRVVCYPWARTWYSLPVYKIWRLSLQTLQRYHWGPQNLKRVTWSWPRPV